MGANLKSSNPRPGQKTNEDTIFTIHGTHPPSNPKGAWVSTTGAMAAGAWRCSQGKSKVVSVLFFNWVPHHEDVFGEWRYICTHSLTSALDAGEWWSFMPLPLYLRKRAPSTYWIGGWVDPRAGLDALVKRKIPSPCRDSNSRPCSPNFNFTLHLQYEYLGPSENNSRTD
jgi:hypothetical protein